MNRKKNSINDIWIVDKKKKDIWISQTVRMILNLFFSSRKTNQTEAKEDKSKGSIVVLQSKAQNPFFRLLSPASLSSAFSL